ncbi:MAG: carboxy terminal-processing peptidase [Desulfotignum sp.]|nr:carboxy terminal-processing peptidase [Desulfotignum sp.]
MRKKTVYIPLSDQSRSGLNRIFFVVLFLVLLLCSVVYASQAVLAPQKNHMIQCVRIMTALERYHFLDKNLDDTLSEQIFDRYIKYLDPSRHLFIRQDLDRVRQFRYRFDTDLKKGDLKLAYDIYNLYHYRATQRLEYILDLIKTWKTTLPLHTRETLIVDIELRPWQPSLDDLRNLWKKELTHHIITLKLDNQTDSDITKTLEKIYDARLSRLSQTNTDDVFQLFMNSVTESFDPHTQYFLPRISEDFEIHMSLSLEGIGAVLQTEYEYTKVVSLVPKGPADKSNLLMPGDKIIGVGQGKTGDIKDTIGLRIDEVVKLIRGPKNTYVRLKIIPAKKSSTTAIISIRRDTVKLEDQSAQKQVKTIFSGLRNYKIGIIEIPNFYIDFAAYHRGDKEYKSTTTDVKKLLFELKQENIDGLIIDLRDNGGGSLKEASDLTGLFLTSGPTVQIRTKNQITRLYDEDPKIQYTGPLLVLINRMSASASEIFAGAIKDYQRGVIVGTQSFGKGTVQELKPLGDGKLKLTSAKFYRVSGKSTQHRGVIPNISFPRMYKPEETGESSLDGALLWDTIPGIPYQAYPSLAPLYKPLAGKYQERISRDPGMRYLEKRLELITRLNSEDSLSLDIDKRRKKRVLDEQAELDIENQYLAAMKKDPVDSLDNQEPILNRYKEILLQQAQWVMADMILLAKQQGYAW